MSEKKALKANNRPTAQRPRPLWTLPKTGKKEKSPIFRKITLTDALRPKETKNE